ncbi:MAG: hypothetical protein EXS46_03410 [Candidatus Taylorbacteria bacterium]|nr:hypothetical protein [Candidatus Taylorbacteria bacterium]
MPSKKNILLLGLAIISISFLYFIIFSSTEEIYIAPTIATSTAESAILSKDSDSDSLKDWEEGLWKTDPLNADTDGDGTEDGAEIKNGRDPLTKGPNDKLDTDTVTNKINSETDNDLTETDKFSRELFVKIIAAKNSGTPPTEKELEAFLSSTVQTQLKNQKIKHYTEGDFQVETSESKEKIKQYGNALATILTEKTPEPLEYEIAIVDRATQKNDPSELKKLDPLIAQYQKIESELFKMTVPKSAVQQHILFTERVSGMIYSITGLKYILSDPIKALPGVSSYAENAESFLITAHQFKNYFDTSGVIFDQTDHGYDFFDKL